MSDNAAMRALLPLGLLASIAAAPAHADYSPQSLAEMAATADLIVLGEIQALDGLAFTVDIEHVLAGTAPQGPLRVRCFEDWMCAHRWAPYALGERVLLLLARPAKGEMIGDRPAWSILSGGGEGEMPVIGNRLYYRSVASVSPRGAPRVPPAGAELHDADTFIRAIVAFRGLYRWHVGDRGYTITSIDRLVDESAIDRFKRTSPLNARMVEDAERTCEVVASARRR